VNANSDVPNRTCSAAVNRAANMNVCGNLRGRIRVANCLAVRVPCRTAGSKFTALRNVTKPSEARNRYVIHSKMVLLYPTKCSKQGHMSPSRLAWR
jgi:hypothetical protein